MEPYVISTEVRYVGASYSDFETVLNVAPDGIVWGLPGGPPETVRIPWGDMQNVEVTGGFSGSDRYSRLVVHCPDRSYRFDVGDLSGQALVQKMKPVTDGLSAFTRLKVTTPGPNWEFSRAAPSFCAQCGVPLVPGSNFCPTCGTPIAAGHGTGQPEAIRANPPNVAGRGNTGSFRVPGMGGNPAPQVSASDEPTAWLVAIAPLIGLASCAIIAENTGAEVAVGISWVVFVVINTLLIIWDRSALKAKGLRLTSLAAAYFLVPAYLFKRQSLLGRTSVVPVVWIVCFLATVLLDGPVTGFAAEHSNVQLDMNKVQQSILTKVNPDIPGGATVKCPSHEPSTPGLTFTCVITANADQSTAFADVTVENGPGDIVWQVRQ